MRIMCVRARVCQQDNSPYYYNLCALSGQCEKASKGEGASAEIESKVGARDSPEWFGHASINVQEEARKDDDDVKFAPTTSKPIKDDHHPPTTTDSDHVLFSFLCCCVPPSE